MHHYLHSMDVPLYNTTSIYTVIYSSWMYLRKTLYYARRFCIICMMILTKAYCIRGKIHPSTILLTPKLSKRLPGPSVVMIKFFGG